MKVVINSDYGGFGVSILAMKHILQRKGITGIVFKDALNNQVIKKDISDALYYMCDSDGEYFNPDLPRDDIDLIAVIEELGDKANARYSSLKIVEIPDGVNYEIEEYDGSEWLSEVHRKWS